LIKILLFIVRKSTIFKQLVNFYLQATRRREKHKEVEAKNQIQKSESVFLLSIKERTSKKVDYDFQIQKIFLDPAFSSLLLYF